MAIESYSDIVTLMVPEVPGASPDVLNFHVRDAARRFCEDSELWLRDATANLESGAAEYSLDLGDDARVQRVRRVRFLDPDNDNADDPKAGRVISPACYNVVTEDDGTSTLQLFGAGIPTDADDGFTLLVTASWVPGNVDEDTLPVAFLARWADAIRYRAMSTMMFFPNRPWHDPQQAAVYVTLYEDMIARARGELHREGKYVNLRMRAPSFT